MAEDTTITHVRPPIVAVMGHVDHGKTTLLDYIRKANVASREHGGITQHLGAYQVVTDQGKAITFLDTPGHAAFEGIRKRGGEVADIVILVVAADDGVMPQTKEAIRHIKNSGSSMIVAFNKIDVPDANIDHVKQQLAENEVLVESYGGDVVSVEISAKTGQGVEQLLEMITLVSELLELTADPGAPVVAFTLESRMDKAGPLASLLVKRGTLKTGMDMNVDGVIGRIRAMKNDKGEIVKEVLPSQAAEITGFPKLPEAGTIFIEEDGKLSTSDSVGALSVRHVALQKESAADLFSGMKIDKYPIILKADVAGSLEAVVANIPRTNEVQIIDQGIGDIGESDIMKARGTGSRIYSFNVGINATSRKLARDEKVEVKEYKIIYKLFEDLEKDIVDYFTKAPTETISGKATILKVFDATIGGKIAGVKISEGIMQVGATIRVMRGETEVGRGKIATVKKLKEDVQRIAAGQEGGLTFDTPIAFAETDTIEYYKPIVKA
ncbi:MAG: translation initiation factor IF-2 [bacterium]|nr:translation initiation factor IF-2 [bacterium]